MRISDWSSDVCSSDLVEAMRQCTIDAGHANPNLLRSDCDADELRLLYNPRKDVAVLRFATPIDFDALLQADDVPDFARTAWADRRVFVRSEGRRVGNECVSTCRARWSPDN